MASGELILIVDDEVATLQLLGMALEREGYRIGAAQTAQQAIERVEQEVPSLAVVDVMLPGRSGLDLCLDLRNRADTANLPIILLSAKGEVADRVAGLKSGADEYLTKPIDTKEFIARVASLLERTRRLLVASASSSARAVSFIGAKGGVGTTACVVNVGVALALSGVSVAAVELRGHMGSFPILLGLKVADGISRLSLAEPREITQQAVAQRMVSHASGMRALCAPAEIGPGLLPQPAADAILRALSGLAQVLVVDLPPFPAPSVLAALPLSQVVCLVVEPLRESVERATRMASFVESQAASGASLGVLIVSRAPIASPISRTEISERLRWPILGAIPPAPDEFLRAANLGKTILEIYPEGILSQTIRDLAEKLKSPQASRA